MRRRWLSGAFFLLAVLLLNPEPAPGQPGGGPGGFSSKGSSRGAPDPERAFGFLSKNGDAIDFARMDPNQRRFAQSMFERNGLPVPPDNAVITKAQFVDSMTRAQAARGMTPSAPTPGGYGSPGGFGGPPGGFSGRGFGGPPGSFGSPGAPMMMQTPGSPGSYGGPPGGFSGRSFGDRGSSGFGDRGPGSFGDRGPGGYGGPGGPPTSYSGPSGYGGGPGGAPPGDVDEQDLLRKFRDRDKNGDNRVSIEEASDRLRPIFQEYDRNRDGFVDYDEYRAYMVSTGQTRGSRGPDGGPSNGGSGGYSGGPGGYPGGPGGPGGDRRQEDMSLVAIRYGKLPSGLPDWWTELDTDKDGQVGLYEWRAGSRDMKEFLTMDLNTDGLLAPQEFIRYTSAKAEQDRLAAANDPDAPTSPSPGRGTRGGGYGAPGAGFGPGSGGSFNGPGNRGSWSATPGSAKGERTGDSKGGKGDRGPDSKGEKGERSSEKKSKSKN